MLVAIKYLGLISSDDFWKHKHKDKPIIDIDYIDALKSGKGFPVILVPPISRLSGVIIRDNLTVIEIEMHKNL